MLSTPVRVQRAARAQWRDLINDEMRTARQYDVISRWEATRVITTRTSRQHAAFGRFRRRWRFGTRTARGGWLRTRPPAVPISGASSCRSNRTGIRARRRTTARSSWERRRSLALRRWKNGGRSRRLRSTTQHTPYGRRYRRRRESNRRLRCGSWCFRPCSAYPREGRWNRGTRGLQLRLQLWLDVDFWRPRRPCLRFRLRLCGQRAHRRGGIHQARLDCMRAAVRRRLHIRRVLKLRLLMRRG